MEAVLVFILAISVVLVEILAFAVDKLALIAAIFKVLVFAMLVTAGTSISNCA